MPLSALLADAIRYAQDGVPVTLSQAMLTAQKWPELRDVPGFRPTYAENGPPEEGAILKQPQLAATLSQLAEAGLDDFYRGDLARLMAKGLKAAGSPLRLADLKAFSASRVEPLSLDIRAGTVFNMPPPTQGVSSLMILGIFDRLGVTEPESFAHIHGLIEATKRAFILRNAHLGDPVRMSPGWRDWLGPDSAGPGGEKRSIENARRRGPMRDIRAIRSGWALPTAPAASSAIFKAPIGSSAAASWCLETGIVWHNRGASFTLGDGPNALGPGRLPLHTLNPALARLRDGRTLAYGTMGGEGQPQTQAAIFTRHVNFGEDMQAAVTAPRWLLGRTWGAETTNLKLESRFPPELIKALNAAGHDIELVGAFDDMMGHAGMVSIDARGVISGATDPRADGACASL